jgi:hypothetical protein
VLALVIRPGSVAAGLEATQAWLAGNGWTIVAFAAAACALLQGIGALSRAAPVCSRPRPRRRGGRSS